MGDLPTNILEMSAQINTVLATMRLDYLYRRRTIRACNEAIEEVCMMLERYQKEVKSNRDLCKQITLAINESKTVREQILAENNPTGDDQTAVAEAEAALLLRYYFKKGMNVIL